MASLRVRSLLLGVAALLLLAAGSSGLHTYQLMFGCEAGPDGRFRGGHVQYAYDGEDFISLDLETVTWTARVPQALPTKRRWERETHNAQRDKDYLEEECVHWLQKYLGYGAETLLRTENVTRKVARKRGHDGQETIFCQLYGFYPKDIEVTWMKDGEDRKQDTLTGGIVPNSDGTYHTWLSIEVDPEERDRYRCRVGHDSLLEPLDLAWEEPEKRSRGYQVAAGSDQGSDNSSKAFIWLPGEERDIWTGDSCPKDDWAVASVRTATAAAGKQALVFPPKGKELLQGNGSKTAMCSAHAQRHSCRDF